MYLGRVHGYLILLTCAITNTVVTYTGYHWYDSVDSVTWCTVNKEEQRKCEHWMKASNLTAQLGTFRQDLYLKLKCRQSFNKEECMNAIDQGKADMTMLDAGEVFEGGRYHSLVPIMQENVKDDQGQTHFTYYAVAVIKRGDIPYVNHLSDLRGVQACFAGVGTLAGWIMPLYMLVTHGGMEIVDCNNYVKSAINFFGPSCAVNSLIDKYNPIGDNSDKLCHLCIGRVPGEKCSSGDPYAGYEGAFKCLRERGQIAFLKHTTVSEMLSLSTDLSGAKKSDFQLLCPDGSRQDVDKYRFCNWGEVPTAAVVVSSAKPAQDRQRYQDFLKESIRLFGSAAPFGPSSPAPPYGDSNYFGDNFFSRPPGNLPPQNPDYNYPNRPVKREAPTDGTGRRTKRQFDNYIQDRPVYFDPNDDGYKPPLPDEPFHIFSSTPRYGTKLNLLLQDNTLELTDLSEVQQDYNVYLGRVASQIAGIRKCPVQSMTLCVTSQAELDKCIKMRSALNAHLLKPELLCSRAHSHIGCMDNIRNNLADITVLDASDVYTAGLRYGLIPFMAEIYNLGEPSYYAVAVAKEEDPTTELTYLKGKNTCHTGINTAAGWVIPMAYLLSNSWIRPYGCDSVRAAAEYFTKSCVPGALSNEYNIGVPYDNLCHLCHGASHRYCSRDASEDYYGHIGALRCLVEGGGHVAFIKHTTVNEIVDGKRAEWWARNALKGDFQLLCPDGRRAPIDMYQKCNLGKAKSNAVVTRGGAHYNETELNAFINVLIYAQQFNGKREADEFSFSMFSSPEPFSDLIFQDATLQLMVLNQSQRNYASYLGPHFLRARRIVDCYASAGRLEIKYFTLLLPLLSFLIS